MQEINTVKVQRNHYNDGNRNYGRIEVGFHLRKGVSNQKCGLQDTEYKSESKREVRKYRCIFVTFKIIVFFSRQSFLVAYKNLYIYLYISIYIYIHVYVYTMNSSYLHFTVILHDPYLIVMTRFKQ